MKQSRTFDNFHRNPAIAVVSALALASGGCLPPIITGPTLARVLALVGYLVVGGLVWFLWRRPNGPMRRRYEAVLNDVARPVGHDGD